MTCRFCKSIRIASTTKSSFSSRSSANLSPAREHIKGVQFVRGRRAIVAVVDLNAAATDAPHETITAAIEENDAAVAADILTPVREQDPAFLENLVLNGLTAMGYGDAASSAERLGRSGDEGLDGVIKQDRSASTESTSRRSATPQIAASAAQIYKASLAHSMARTPIEGLHHDEPVQSRCLQLRRKRSPPG